eukprot:930074-Rhodomonas_salina.1
MDGHRVAARRVGDLACEQLRVLGGAQHQPRALLHIRRRHRRPRFAAAARDADLPLVELKEVLLRPDDAPRAHNPQPRDGFPRAPAVVRHDPRRNQRPGPPQTRRAMHRNHAGLVVGHLVEVAHDLRRRRGAVVKVQVVVCDVARSEGSLVVRVRVVQAHDTRDVQLLEERHELLWLERPPVGLGLGQRPTEGDELGAHDVDIRVLGVVEHFVVLHVKRFVAEEARFDGSCQAPEAIKKAKIKC